MSSGIEPWSPTKQHSLQHITLGPVFRTNDNSSEVQTTTVTTYSLCDGSEDKSAAIYDGGSAGGPGSKQALIVAVPLTEEGTNYFFSNSDDDAQSQQRMRFEIKVEHGRGLPPSLKNPPPAPKERVLAPPPARTAFSSTEGVEPGDGEADRTGGDRAVAAAGGRFFGVAVGAALAILVALWSWWGHDVRHRSSI
ncbi:hypothetical protein ACP70R_018263 [Stipagrostis hirtigluma subsp. patula]